MPRIEHNGDFVPNHGRKVSNPLTKGKHLTLINDDDDVDDDDGDDDDDDNDDMMMMMIYLQLKSNSMEMSTPE